MLPLLLTGYVIFQLFGGVNGNFNFTTLNFPEDFIFGVATASYQIEGAWNVSGKGENIWDHLTHTNPDAIINRDNGDVACDSYYKYIDDIHYIKEIGFKMYRFSLSWSRLFPEGNTTKLNGDGVKYYNAVIDELLLNGIEPMVTLYHWDLPQPLQDIEGWLNSDIADIFGEYSRICFQLFGDRVKWWLTINEPVLITKGYGKTDFAPMLNQHGTGEYISGHNLLRAHAKAYRIYENEFKAWQGGKVSMAFFGNFYFPKNESSSTDVEATERINQFTLGWFAHPIFSEEGDYPNVMKEFVKKKSLSEGRNISRLPEFTVNEINELKGSCDFFGLNHYSSKLATSGEAGENPSIDKDMQVVYSQDPNWPQTVSPTFQVVPQGISGALWWIKNHYKNPAVFITENGFCDNDGVKDESRISYHTEYLKEVLAAMDDGCKVIGYNAWSLLDNFEWMKGYSITFGLIHVDFKDPSRPRTKKLSSQFFENLIRNQTRGNAPLIKSCRLIIFITLVITKLMLG